MKQSSNLQKIVNGQSLAMNLTRKFLAVGSLKGASPEELYHLKVEVRRAKTNDQMKGVRNGTKKKTHRRTDY